LTTKCIFLLTVCLMLTAPAMGGHTLSSAEQQVLKSWLALHPEYRQATDEDCVCAADVQQMRAGAGGIWKPVRDYHPYTATGDFNNDGVEDFAVVLIDRRKKERISLLSYSTAPSNRRHLQVLSWSPVWNSRTKGFFTGRHDQSHIVSCWVRLRAIRGHC
jgi:hypothetical protein